MPDIPLVRARYVCAFAAVLNRLGAPTSRMLERAGLSSRLLEQTEAVHPAHQAWDFIGSAALQEGIDDFGLQAADHSIDAYGEFSCHLLQATNLNGALDRFCHLARHEYSQADFFVIRNPDRVRFCRGPIEGNPAEKKHVELFVLKMMIATVGLFAAPDWRPREIRLQTEDPHGIADHPSFSSSDLRFRSATTSFEIPSILLTQRMPQRPRPISRCYERLDDDIVGALRFAIVSLPLNRDWNIHCVAEAVGMRPRTLQRALSQADTTFSALVDDVRMSTAMSMLAGTSLKVRDIALELRYSDQANFTRAFRRWAGISPQAYRSQQSTDRDEQPG